MFHIKYPQNRGFYTWDELGCLARALGFPKDLFKLHVTEEIGYEENGLPEKEIFKMVEYNLLFKALHLSLNNHTADWNCCVIKKAISILDKQALSFEEIYNIRLAYQAYEAIDMKGMLIECHTILRTLKMCGKTISPLKLMHRVKHSQDSFEEPGRMQLYEFLDLILWANDYEPYIPHKTYGHFEMEDEMFKLLDFDKLLSHHDQRLADRLDQEYVEDECTFSQEKHGDKGRFKEPPVACSDSRMEMARDQKKTYHGLKQEVTSSQKMVYYSQQGFVRPRPLTAPNLAPYRQTDAEMKRKMSEAAHNFLYNKYQKILKNAYNTGKAEKVQVDHSERPVVDDYTRCETPKFVTENDLRETNEDFQNLMFNKETAKARYEIMMDTEMDHYIPEYREKWLEMKENSINPQEVLRRKAWKEKNYKYTKSTWPKDLSTKVKDTKTGRYDDDDIINHLTYPVNRLPPSHAKKCDARFRGWYDTKHKKGPHYILTSPYFHNSPKGRLMQKLAKLSDAEIDKLHGDFLFRFTKKMEVESRPLTAPPGLGKGRKTTHKGTSSGYHSMEEKSRKTTLRPNIDVNDVDKLVKGSADKNNLKDERDTGERKATITETDAILEEIQIKLNKIEGKRLKNYGSESETEELEQGLKPEAENGDTVIKQGIETVIKQGIENENDLVQNENMKSEKSDEKNTKEMLTKSRPSSETSASGSMKMIEAEKPKTKIRSKSAHVNRHDKLQNEAGYDIGGYVQPRAKSAMESGKTIQELIPMPYMDHSKPKMVSVGSIGKISLLESISESKYWEDVLLEELAKRQAEQGNENLSGSDSDLGYSDIENDAFEPIRTSSPKKRSKSKSSRGSGSAILALILEEEKARRRKVRSRSSEYSVLTKRKKSPSAKSPRSNRSSISEAALKEMDKSPIDVKKTVTDYIKGNLSEDNIKMEENDIVRNKTDTKLNDKDTEVKNESMVAEVVNKNKSMEEGSTVEKKDSAITHEKDKVLSEKENKADKTEVVNLKEDSKRKESENKSKLKGNENKMPHQATLNRSNLKKVNGKETTGKLEANVEAKKQKKVIILSNSSLDKSSFSKKPAKKSERLVKRMDGCISETLAKRLLAIS